MIEVPVIKWLSLVRWIHRRLHSRLFCLHVSRQQRISYHLRLQHWTAQSVFQSFWGLWKSVMHQVEVKDSQELYQAKSEPSFRCCHCINYDSLIKERNHFNFLVTIKLIYNLFWHWVVILKQECKTSHWDLVHKLAMVFHYSLTHWCTRCSWDCIKQLFRTPVLHWEDLSTYKIVSSSHA